MPFSVTFKHLNLAFLTDCKLPEGKLARLDKKIAYTVQSTELYEHSSILLPKVTVTKISLHLSTYYVPGIVLNALQPYEVHIFTIFYFVDVETDIERLSYLPRSHS